MGSLKDNLIKTIKHTLPICLSYIFLGLAFGISLSAKAHQGPLYSFLASTFVFAGSMQFVMIDFIAEQTPYYMVALMTVVINARYAVYGLSFNEHYKDVPWYKKWYLAYSLSDETYSLLVATSLPFKENNHQYDFMVHAANHIYWIVGCVIGSLVGQINFDFTGIDFVMTAMFVCIFIDQIRDLNPWLPAVIAILSSILCLIIVGKYFILPSLALTITFLFIFRGKIERKETSNVSSSK